jgi:hypothetical protein
MMKQLAAFQISVAPLVYNKEECAIIYFGWFRIIININPESGNYAKYIVARYQAYNVIWCI